MVSARKGLHRAERSVGQGIRIGVKAVSVNEKESLMREAVPAVGDGSGVAVLPFGMPYCRDIHEFRLARNRWQSLRDGLAPPTLTWWRWRVGEQDAVGEGDGR